METGYERARYQDFTASLGGPISSGSPVVACRFLSTCVTSAASRGPIRRRQGLRNRTRYSRSSRGGSLPAGNWFRVFTTKSGWTRNNRALTKPIASTVRFHGRTPAITFGQLTHTLSASSVWDIRVEVPYLRAGRRPTQQPDYSESTQQNVKRRHRSAGTNRHRHRHTYNSKTTSSLSTGVAGRRSPVEGGRRNRTRGAPLAQSDSWWREVCRQQRCAKSAEFRSRPTPAVCAHVVIFASNTVTLGEGSPSMPACDSIAAGP